MLTEDLIIFFDTDELADTVTIDGGSVTIVDSGVVSAFSDTEYVVLDTWSFSVQEADVSLVVGQSVTVNSELWEVSTITNNSGVLDVSLVRRSA